MKKFITAMLLFGFCNLSAMASSPGFGTVTMAVTKNQPSSQLFYSAVVVGYNNNSICGELSKNIYLYNPLKFVFGSEPRAKFCPQGADTIIMQACNLQHCTEVTTSPNGDAGACAIVAEPMTARFNHHVSLVFPVWTNSCGAEPPV